MNFSDYQPVTLEQVDEQLTRFYQCKDTIQNFIYYDANLCREHYAELYLKGYYPSISTGENYRNETEYIIHIQK